MINEATLIGRVGKKDMRTLKNGSNMATLSLATTNQWVDKSGTKQVQTVWHNVNFFDKLADIANKYAHVGDLVYVRGQINHKEIPDGEKKGQWTYSITAKEIKLLPNAKKEKEAETQYSRGTINLAQAKMNIYEDLNDQIPF
jgi:single-strand DNA-binding protein